MMAGREITSRLDNVLRNWPPRVTAAALAFEARWTRNALRRTFPALADKFDQQTQLFRAAVEDGTAEQIEIMGGGMCRGYAICAAAMGDAKVEDDAYLIGHDPETGTTVAIGEARAAVDRVRERYGPEVAFFTPDEVATLFALDKRIKKIAAVKEAFPGAEIVAVGERED